MKVTGVSFSSDKKLSRCEQQYFYRYDEGLKPRVKSKGLYMGDLMHQLLEAYRRKLDWEKVWTRFKKESWDKLFDEEKGYLEEKGFSMQLAFDLMAHYCEHWEAQDAHMAPLFIEQDFILKSKLGIPVRFKADYIARDGKVIVLFENKNKGEIPDADERMLAIQPHAYCYLLSKLPQPIHVGRITWDYIRTEPVPSPKILKDGSLSERKINTDQRTYLRAMKEAKIHPKGDEAMGVENFLKTLPETLSLQRITNKPNLKVGELFVRDWLERARRAKNITRPTRTYTRNCRWDCDYLKICRADMLGNVDRQTIINKDFVTRIKKAGG